MSCNVSDGRETEVGDTGSPVPVDQYVCLRRQKGHEYGDILFEKESYPFQISVDYAKVVHILQAVPNINQLNIA